MAQVMYIMIVMKPVEVDMPLGKADLNGKLIIEKMTL